MEYVTVHLGNTAAHRDLLQACAVLESIVTKAGHTVRKDDLPESITAGKSIAANISQSLIQSCRLHSLAAGEGMVAKLCYASGQAHFLQAAAVKGICANLRQALGENLFLQTAEIEGIIGNSYHTFGDRNGFQTGTAAEGAVVIIPVVIHVAYVQHLLPAQGEVHLAQTSTVEECIRSDSGHAVGNMDRFQCRAVFKCIGINRGQALGKVDRFQRCTILEGMSADAFHRAGQGDLLQTGAVFKRTAAYIAQSFIQPHVLQGGTAVEHAAAHGLYGIREHNGFQGHIIPEGVVCDPLDDVAAQLRGDGYLRFRAGIACELAEGAVEHIVAECILLGPGHRLREGSLLLRRIDFRLGLLRGLNLPGYFRGLGLFRFLRDLGLRGLRLVRGRRLLSHLRGMGVFRFRQLRCQGFQHCSPLFRRQFLCQCRNREHGNHHYQTHNKGYYAFHHCGSLQQSTMVSLYF